MTARPRALHATERTKYSARAKEGATRFLNTHVLRDHDGNVGRVTCFQSLICSTSLPTSEQEFLLMEKPRFALRPVILTDLSQLEY